MGIMSKEPVIMKVHTKWHAINYGSHNFIKAFYTLFILNPLKLMTAFAIGDV